VNFFLSRAEKRGKKLLLGHSLKVKKAKENFLISINRLKEAEFSEKIVLKKFAGKEKEERKKVPVSSKKEKKIHK
jgi:hypothetical protein